MSLGQIIRKKREQLSLTLDEVSSRTGFSKPYLSTIETGKVKIMSVVQTCTTQTPSLSG